MQNDRRNFLKQFGGAAAVTAFASSAWANETAAPASLSDVILSGARPPRKNYVTARCLLELDGVMCGWLWYAEGGSVTADVLETPAGPDGIVKKQLGPAKYEDILLYCGAGLNQTFYNWVKTLFSRQPQRKSGAVIYLDSNGREVSRLGFTNAQVVEAGFSALDPTWTGSSVLTIRLTPESTRRSRDGAGRLFNLAPEPLPRWLESNFRLAIDGLEETTSRALVIEAIVTRQQPLIPLEFSDLIVTFPVSKIPPMEAWFEDFVVKGNNTDDKKKNGRLELLLPDQQTVLFVLSFERLGIFRLDPVMFNTGNRLVNLVQTRMCCENIRFDHYLG